MLKTLPWTEVYSITAPAPAPGPGDTWCEGHVSLVQHLNLHVEFPHQLVLVSLHLLHALPDEPYVVCDTGSKEKGG